MGAEFDAEAVIGADASGVAIAAHDYHGVGVQDADGDGVDDRHKASRTMVKLELGLRFSYLAQLQHLQASSIYLRPYIVTVQSPQALLLMVHLYSPW